jgi:hypothetical protein
MPSVLLSGAYQKPAKKSKVPKTGGEPAAKGGIHTQVGELDDEMKEPTPAMRITKAAHDEKVAATRDWIAGRMSTKKHQQAHSRANHAIKHAHKLGK